MLPHLLLALTAAPEMHAEAPAPRIEAPRAGKRATPPRKPSSPPARTAPKPAPKPAPVSPATTKPKPTAQPSSPPARPAPKPAPKPAPRPGPTASPSPSAPAQPADRAPSASPAGSRPPTASPVTPRATPSQRLGGPSATVQPGTARLPAQGNLPGPSVAPPTLGQRPAGALRPFDTKDVALGTVRTPGGGSGAVPPQRDPDDVRYARPTTDDVRPPPYTHSRVPVVYTYRAYYTRWYCHPWYRWHYATWAVVYFDFSVWPWYDGWVPPPRWGWYWVPGGWYFGYWHPGYWAPVAPPPIGYVYVPGWWENDAYVEGYWRVEERDGWEWVDGYYLEDGTFVRGHWRPTGDGPEGYVWEPGFWDGQQYVDGFWRPQFRTGYVWVSSYYDADGVFRTGYWKPLEERPGHVWIPGWFDGNEWVPGYWVPEEEYTEDALEEWTPPEGQQDGWERERDPRVYPPEDAPPPARIIEDGEPADAAPAEGEPVEADAPLAIPVTPPEE